MTSKPYSASVAYPGSATLDWNTDDSLDSVTKGDTLKIGTAKASRIIMGNAATPGSDVQLESILTSGQLIGTFKDCYEADEASGITAEQDASGTITGYGTAFQQEMVQGGVILWQDGGTTPLSEFASETSLIAVTLQMEQEWPQHKRQPFKIYYGGVYMDGRSGVLGCVSLAAVGTSDFIPRLINEDNQPVVLNIETSATEAFSIADQDGVMISFNSSNNTIQTTAPLVQNSPQSYLPNLITVADPSNENAEAAGVPNMGLYRGAADPHIIYQRVDP